MSTLEIVELVVLGVVALVLIVYYSIMAIKNKWVSTLVDTIDKAIRDAEEQYPDGHGEEKKAMVLKAVEDKCEELGIPFALIKTLVGKIIDKVVRDYNVFVK